MLGVDSKKKTPKSLSLLATIFKSFKRLNEAHDFVVNYYHHQFFA
jgi:hypothetical protein